MEWLKWVHSGTSDAPAFRAGDDIRVWFKIKEQGKQRLAQFQGVVLRVRGAGPSKTFTVRRVTFGEGVERVFPLDASIIDRIEVLRRVKVRRSRIYFLRDVLKRVRFVSADPPGARGDKAAGTSESKSKSAESESPNDAMVAADKASTGDNPKS